MQIACPTCATSYEVSASSIGAAGRSVRCLRCRATWFASPPLAPGVAGVPHPAVANDETVAAFREELGGATPDAAPPHELSADALIAAGAPDGAGPAPDIETAAAAAGLADNPVDVAANERPSGPAGDDPQTIADAPPLVPNPPDSAPPADIERIAQRRRRPAARFGQSKSKTDRRLIAAIFGLLAIVGALIGFRAEIVRRVPQLASLYSAVGMPVNLRKMIFTDVRLAKEIHDGVPVLMVEGTILSTSPTPIDVPRLRFAVRNSAGAEVYTWTTLPSQPKLAPFDALVFRSRLASPPGDGRDVVVRFFNRRDAVANLR